MLIVTDVSAMFSKKFPQSTACLSYVFTVSGLFRFGASHALD